MISDSAERRPAQTANCFRPNLFRNSDPQGERDITAEHEDNNRAVRQMLVERGIVPENLPPAEDVKKVERRLASEEKKTIGTGNS